MAEYISPESLPEIIYSLGKKRVFLALDGPSAAGKTTLAGSLVDRFGWTLLHMDDFFLRPEQRTAERYAMPGGNVDHERFRAEVLEPLHAGREAVYRPLDCATLTLAEPICVQAGSVVLAEGAYACHPALWELFDLHLFLPVDPDTQRERILHRNGPKAETFFDRWIPLEQTYFDAYDLPDKCDYILTR